VVAGSPLAGSCTLQVTTCTVTSIERHVETGKMLRFLHLKA